MLSMLPTRLRQAVLLGGLFLLALTMPTLAQAQVEERTFKFGFDKVFKIRDAAEVKKFDTVPEFVLAVLGVVATFIAVLALAALLYGAVLYITSLGDEGKTEKAKKIIIYAIVGIVILGAAGIIVNVAINLIST